MSSGIEDVVREKYGAVAASPLSGEHAGVRGVAEAFGYSAEELSSLPAEANMGLSCGNPTATANLRPGEVVVDLGCGGGLDVFLAARKVGPSGKAVGIDMTPAMLERARAGAGRLGLSNVEFHESTIDAMPLPDASVDCVISNCVVNLAPDKRAVFREIARVLKPGGRVAISDIALKGPLPPEVVGDLLAYVGCIAGAIPIEEYREGLEGEGFADVEIIDSGADLNAYGQIEGQVGCCGGEMVADPVAIGPLPGGDAAIEAGASCCSTARSGETPEVLARLAELARRHDINAYAASVKIFAVKP